MIAILFALFAFLQLRTGRFFTPGNLSDLATDTALLGIVALGALLVLLVGGIDISLGSLMAVAGGVAGKLWESGTPLPVVVGVAIGLGALGGFLNATLSLVGRVHPIVITLGTMSLYRGVAVWWLREDVTLGGEARAFFTDPLYGLPLLGWVGMIVAVAVAVFLNRTVPGRHFYAVGSNPAAARRLGLSPGHAWLAAFTTQGALAGLAGLLYLARSGGMQAVSYEDVTLAAIGAAVIGGVALTGGRGTVTGVLLGCLLLVSLGPACVLLGIPNVWQRTLVGVVTVAAVVLDALWRRKSG